MGARCQTHFVKEDLLGNKAVEMDSVLLPKYRKGFFWYLRNQILYSREPKEKETAWHRFGKCRLRNKDNEGK